MKRWLLVMAWPVLLTGCIEADLGEVPLLCNSGVPHCPQGYQCVHYQQRDYCLREGVDPHRLGALVDGGSD